PVIADQHVAERLSEGRFLHLDSLLGVDRQRQHWFVGEPRRFRAHLDRQADGTAFDLRACCIVILCCLIAIALFRRCTAGCQGKYNGQARQLADARTLDPSGVHGAGSLLAGAALEFSAAGFSADSPSASDWSLLCGTGSLAVFGRFTILTS